MLVVIGIILLVIGLATPMITRAWRAGDRAASFNDLQVIAAALDAYRTDHGDYPRVRGEPFQNADKDFNGARMLCRALIGPGPAFDTDPKAISDGKGGSDTDLKVPGPGFRVRGTQGQVYGPYLRVENFKLGNPKVAPGTANQPPGLLAILDRYGKPVLYYPGLGKPNLKETNGFVKAYDSANPPKDMRPLYNANDNTGGNDNTRGIPAALFPKLMGDLNANGKIDPTQGEAPAHEGPYVLWSAGPDEVFGPNPPNPPANQLKKAIEQMDDITNFRQ
jgi:type II secretory pathway pseudopilin PulG